MKIKIGKRFIGDGAPCFVIAEAGSNHDGDFKQALALIDVASDAKADAVKFQTFKAHKIYTKKAGHARYLKDKKSIYEIIKDMEMPVEWIPKLAQYCKKKKIMFLSTPFDNDSADILEKHMPLFKISSYEMTDIPLVEHVAKKGKPIILSTGTAHLDEVGKTVQAIRAVGNRDLILMQCTACYPAPLESININTIQTMKKEFHLPVGLSDHSRAYDVAPMAAVAVGACCIEKHFTLSNGLSGPDHKYAIEPHELKLMVQKIRDVEKVLGTGKKDFHSVEKDLRSFARRSLFAIRVITKGQIITKDDIEILRNGILKPGLDPVYYDQILGKKAKRSILQDHPIRQGDV